MDESGIERRLEAIASILKLAFREQIAEVGESLRSETGKAAILDSTGGWTPAGALVNGVAKKTGRSKRSIQRDLSSLLELGVLEKRGAASSIEYRSTGII